VSAAKAGDRASAAGAPALAVVGASWGGLEALGRLLEGLDPAMPIPLALVQHRSPESPDSVLVDYLQRHSPLPVEEAEDKTPIEPGRVYLAPPDYHLIVEQGSFSLSTEGPVRFCRPSIDVTMESAADAYGARVVAVVLTGANDDGCRGAAAVHDAGGLVIAQDPARSARAEMPAAVIAAGHAHLVLDLHDIPATLNDLARVP
jgi:two-component system chemotaxis response regulator CheB